MRPLDLRPVFDTIDHNRLLKGTVCWHIEGCAIFLETHPDPFWTRLYHPTVDHYYLFSADMMPVHLTYDWRPMFTGYLRRADLSHRPLFHAQRRWVPGR